jgi:hypothetical protein
MTMFGFEGSDVHFALDRQTPKHFMFNLAHRLRLACLPVSGMAPLLALHHLKNKNHHDVCSFCLLSCAQEAKMPLTVVPTDPILHHHGRPWLHELSLAGD